MLLTLALAIISVFTGAHAHKYAFGGCQDVDRMDAFDLEKFLGKWYVIEVSSPINSCITMNFEKSDTKIEVTKKRKFNSLKILNFDFTGQITIPDPDEPAKMQLKWTVNPLPADFIVIDTDYEQYALTFECQSFRVFSRSSLTILSRENTFNSSFLEIPKTSIKNANLTSHTLGVVDHSDCMDDDDDDNDVEEALFSDIIDDGLLDNAKNSRNDVYTYLRTDPVAEHEPEDDAK